MSNPDHPLNIDPESEVDRIAGTIRHQVRSELKRRGVVVGLSGGVDSSVVAGLCVRALGTERVLGIHMPEEESSDDSLVLGRAVAEQLGIETVTENIGPALRGLGCYARRDAAIREVVPSFDDSHRFKLVISKATDRVRYSFFWVEVEPPTGERFRCRLTARSYLEIVAATNFKQRVRKVIEYYHADRLSFAVAGTPNRLEYDQGFFVKNGDGAADLKPIAHLYKTQVYQLAEWLGIPEAVRSREPTTDTFSLEQSQDEFYFPVPHRQLDMCLYGFNNDVAVDDIAATSGLTPDEVALVYRDIKLKRQATRYLHCPPLLVEEVFSVEPSITDSE